MACKNAVDLPVMEVGVLAVSSSGWATSVPASDAAAGESKMGWRQLDKASFGAYANSVSRSIEAIRGVAADLRAERRTGVTTCTGCGVSFEQRPSIQLPQCQAVKSLLKKCYLSPKMMIAGRHAKSGPGMLIGMYMDKTDLGGP